MAELQARASIPSVHPINAGGTSESKRKIDNGPVLEYIVLGHPQPLSQGEGTTEASPGCFIQPVFSIAHSTSISMPSSNAEDVSLLSFGVLHWGGPPPSAQDGEWIESRQGK
jgi:hypothetical protein